MSRYEIILKNFMNKAKEEVIEEKKPNFRIVELDGVFKIERRFEQTIKEGFFFPTYIKKEVWKEVTNCGAELFRQSIGYGMFIDNYKDKLPHFTNLEEAEVALNKILNPEKPKYHYY